MPNASTARSASSRESVVDIEYGDERSERPDTREPIVINLDVILFPDGLNGGYIRVRKEPGEDWIPNYLPLKRRSWRS